MAGEGVPTGHQVAPLTQDNQGREGGHHSYRTFQTSAPAPSAPRPPGPPVSGLLVGACLSGHSCTRA